MNEEIYYRKTLDSMTPAQIVALLDTADGVPISFHFTDMIWSALSARGLVISWEEWRELADLASETGMSVGKMEIDHQMTDYGKAFVAWYRQPRDTPQQMEMF